ncbi:MAG TPA: purine nucleoside permease [Polyangiaceae bacterium]|jgi:purine nucleoside permease
MGRGTRLGLLAVALAGCGTKGSAPPAATTARAVKVMIVNMSTLEAEPFLGAMGSTEDVPVAGLPSTDPNVHCNADDVCEVTLGMGYANAASSMTVLLYRSGLDLSRAYFLIAGIAGIDPAQGTLGTAAWSRYAVDFGLSYEIDAREMPAGWPYGYFGLETTGPTQAPPTLTGTEVFQLDETMLQAALSLSKGAQLEDDAQAQASRASYPSAPANQAPVVTQCDTTSSDTWIAGTALQQRARDWVTLLTGGAGTFCTSAQEDNASLEVLKRGAATGIVDLHRVALLRSASDFSAPSPGQTDAAGLLASLNSGGLGISTKNLVHAAMPVVQAIVTGWGQWQNGVPAQP